MTEWGVHSLPVAVNEYWQFQRKNPITKLFSGVINWFSNCAKTISNAKWHWMSDCAGSGTSNFQTETTKVEAEEITKQVRINSDRDIGLAEKQKEVHIKEIEFKQEVVKEYSKMFCSYMINVTEAYKAELEFLLNNNIERRTRYLATLESTREEQKICLQLSKETTGQEKLDYLDRVNELEETINNLIEKDSKDEEILKTNLLTISYKQQKGLERSEAQIISVNELFLEYNSKNLIGDNSNE